MTSLDYLKRRQKTVREEYSLSHRNQTWDFTSDSIFIRELEELYEQIKALEEDGDGED